MAEQPLETEPAKIYQGRLDLVDWGLGFHYARLTLLLFCMVAFLGLLILGVFGLEVPESLLIVIDLLAGAILLIAPVVGLTGSLLCLGIPPEAKTRRYLAVALLLDFPLPLAYFALESEPGQLFVYIGAGIVQLLSWAFFMAFLRELARYLEQEVAADEALRLLKFGINLYTGILVFTGVVVWFADFARPVSTKQPETYWPGCFLVLAIPVAIYLLYLLSVFLIKQLNLIGTLRQVIRSRT